MGAESSGFDLSRLLQSAERHSTCFRVRKPSRCGQTAGESQQTQTADEAVPSWERVGGGSPWGTGVGSGSPPEVGPPGVSTVAGAPGIIANNVSRAGSHSF